MVLTERDRACFGPRNAKQPGSVAWCWQTIDLLKSRWERKRFTVQQFEETLQELREQEVWATVPPSNPYGSLDALLEAEIGATQEEAHATLVTMAHPEMGRRKKVVNLTTLSRDERAQKNGIGRVTQYKLDYLATHDPSLLAEVEAQTISPHRAYQQAKGAVPQTPLDDLYRVWRQVSPEDRRHFLTEMLKAERKYRAARRREDMEMPRWQSHERSPHGPTRG